MGLLAHAEPLYTMSFGFASIISTIFQKYSKKNGRKPAAFLSKVLKSARRGVTICNRNCNHFVVVRPPNDGKIIPNGKGGIRHGTLHAVQSHYAPMVSPKRVSQRRYTIAHKRYCSSQTACTRVTNAYQSSLANDIERLVEDYHREQGIVIIMQDGLTDL